MFTAAGNITTSMSEDFMDALDTVKWNKKITKDVADTYKKSGYGFSGRGELLPNDNIPGSNGKPILGKDGYFVERFEKSSDNIVVPPGFEPIRGENVAYADTLLINESIPNNLIYNILIKKHIEVCFMKKISINLEKLKKFIDKFILENGRLPIMKEFQKIKGSPYSQHVIERYLSGTKNICKVLGYDFVYKGKDRKVINEEALKKYIQEFYENNGKLPRTSDIRVSKGAPCSWSLLIDKYGTLRECYKVLGFNTNKVRVHKCSLDTEIMLKFINNYNSKYGVNPGLNDFKRSLGCPYNKSTILDYFGNIESLYEYYGLESKPLSQYDSISDDELFKNLIQAIYKYRTSNHHELRSLSPNTIYDASVYLRRFKSWSTVLERAGFTNYNRVLMFKFVDYQGEDPIPFIKSKIGINGEFTEKQQYYLVNRETNNSTLSKYFKSTNIFKILTNQKINRIGYMTAKQIAKDNHICDSISEKIVDDFLFDNNIVHELHQMYPNNNRFCDFKIKDIYIEYAGLYSSNTKYRKKMHEKIQYAKDNNLKLYVLYDTKQSSLDDMKRFIEENI